MTKRGPAAKLPFLNICATCGFTPVGLAQMAGVSRWAVYAMLDKQCVERETALAILHILNNFSPIKTITYSLENVDIVLKEDMTKQGDTYIAQIL